MFETALIGWDGSPAAEEAAHWALRRPLAIQHRLVRVVDDRRARKHAASPVQREADAERAMQAEIEVLAAAYPAARIAGEVVPGDTMGELGRRTGAATLLVLGSDREPAAASRWRWTAAARVAARARGPVVVVPPGTAGRTGYVVVGVDGSAASSAAASRAAEIAAAIHESLVVLHTWEAVGDPDSPAVLASNGVDVDVLTDPVQAQTLPAAHAALLRSQVAALRTAYPGLTVDGRLVRVAPALALRQWSDGASLLVLGRHSRWSSNALLLGSVTHAMLLASPAPVLVVGRSDGPRTDEPVAAGERSGTRG